MSTYRVVMSALVFAAAVGCVGCAEKEQRRMDEPSPEATSLEEIAPDRGQTDGAADAPPAEQPSGDISEESTEEVVTITPDEPVAGPSKTPPCTHVVRKGDTLFKLARLYYNDQRMWKTIWEANKAKIPDPHQLVVGMELYIP